MSDPDGPSGGHGGRGRIDTRRTQMAAIVLRLSDLLQRPIVDQTHDTRTFNFHLRWTPDVAPLGVESVAADGPTLFTALEEQLGLKLLPQKVQADVLLIDHAELPSDN